METIELSAAMAAVLKDNANPASLIGLNGADLTKSTMAQISSVVGGLTSKWKVVVTDFNNLVEQGIFSISGDGEDNKTEVFVQAQNAPANSYKWGLLIVLSCNGVILQKYHPIGYKSNIPFYFRTYDGNGNWGQWTSVTGTNP